MSYDEYWNQDPWLAADYRKAWELKQQNEDNIAWLQGLYNYKAVSTAVYNALKEKGRKTENYFEQPIGTKNNQKKSIKQQQDELYERLKQWKENWDAGH